MKEKYAQNTIVFHPIDVAKTLSRCRKTKEIEEESQIKYAQVAQWEKEAKTKTPYFALLIVEYFKRENRKEIMRMYTRYELKTDVTKEFLLKEIFPAKEYEGYEKSSKEWKRYIIAHFYHSNMQLLKEQLQYLRGYIEAEYNIEPEKLTLDNTGVPSKKILKERTQHL